MSPLSRDALRALWQQRAHALARFDDWQERQTPRRRSPGELVSAAAGLYELLPRRARLRPIATEGIAELHRRLASLRGAR